MAGIGFRLQKLLAEDSYSSALQAYAYSALVAAGPFVLTVTVVCLINWMSFHALAPLEVFYLQGLITYCFAFSLICAGPCLLVLTRYVADEYYRGHRGAFTAVYFSSVAVNALLWGPPAAFYFSRLSISPSAQLNATLLFLATLSIWLAIIFLSAARDFVRISRAFAAGAALSLAGAWGLGSVSGFDGYFAGFVLGQCLTLWMLSHAILREFGYREPRDFHWLSYFAKHPLLAAIGLFYNLGIWADKFVFWSSPEGHELDLGFYHCPVYDAPMFFAYLSIIPSLCYFLLRMETDFFLKYKAYYDGISAQEGLTRLESRRREMVEVLATNLSRLVLLQAILSGLALLAVPWVTELARLNPLQMGVLRTGILAAFLQVALLISMNLLLYFDFKREACVVIALFCVGNALFSWLSVRFGLPAYGFGYAAACFLALAVCVVYLNRRLADLHFWTFSRQLLPRPVAPEKEDAELPA